MTAEKWDSPPPKKIVWRHLWILPNQNNDRSNLIQFWRETFEYGACIFSFNIVHGMLWIPEPNNTDIPGSSSTMIKHILPPMTSCIVLIWKLFFSSYKLEDFQLCLLWQLKVQFWFNIIYFLVISILYHKNVFWCNVGVWWASLWLRNLK